MMFEYTSFPSTLTFSQYASERLGLDRFIMNPLKDEKICSILDIEENKALVRLLRSSSPESPVLEYEFKMKTDDGVRNARVRCKAIWSEDKTPQYIGAIGIISGF